MIIDTITETPTLVLGPDDVHRSPFGPNRPAWALVHHSPTIAECRAKDIALLEELECAADSLIRNDLLKSYDCRLAPNPPAPDGSPTYIYTVAGSSVRVTTDSTGNALEAAHFRDDRHDERTYWRLSGLSFEEAMNDEVEATLRFNDANRQIITERIHTMEPDDDRPLLSWVGGWYGNASDAQRAFDDLRNDGARVDLHSVVGILDLEF